MRNGLFRFACVGEYVGFRTSIGMSAERRGARVAFGLAAFDALRGGAAAAAARGFVERTRDVTFFARRDTALRARATSDDFAVGGVRELMVAFSDVLENDYDLGADGKLPQHLRPDPPRVTGISRATSQSMERTRARQSSSR